eukprot:TRINITY_DN76093_c0_g1_i1.p1 TRINITY_DN76093_c0_g1~~TRINITY_DN76093_c0_g1_i1.p1  ORF type:complete len:721 (+),score=133.72 TRINITY_DN76093_c0_g1_i1:126-2288(+)
MSEPQDVLGENVTKLLGDKASDKRKQGAIEIEARVKETLLPRNPSASTTTGIGHVQRILECLRRDFIESPQVNHRKGGLIGIASVAIGLESETERFLPQLVLPVLELFKDEEPRVRYYACEALYNISKVAGDTVLAHFNEIFDGLCKLYADVDADVKNGANVLDRQMKDIVTQCPSKFRVVDFIPLLAQRMHFRNPCIRQLVLAWVTLLLKVPEVDMVRYLPQYLEGLFIMLGDQSKDIRHNADACLNELRNGVMSSPPKWALQSISDSASIVVKCCFANDPCSRLTALCWLHEFVHLQMKVSRQVSGHRAETWVLILPDLLAGTLHCIDAQEEEIARMAVEMNNGLLEMMSTLDDEIPVDRLADQLLQSMQSRESMVVRTACLQWICMLLSLKQAQLLQKSTLNRLVAPIFDTLLHPNDEVVVAALTVLAQIMTGCMPEEDTVDGQSDHFSVVTHKMLRLFAANRQMLESRGRLMIRQLCGHVDPRRLYVTVARAIYQETDLGFAQQLVQTFGWILLTATETKSLREELLATAPLTEIPRPTGQGSGGSAAEPVTPLFVELLEPWFHNPVSALALCLFAQQYELASELTARFASFEPTLDLLRQMDQLVHLLESPIFSRLRLRLLEPRRHPALLRCLLALAMLLPQAGAFNILRERIHVVQSGLLLEAHREDTSAKDDKDGHSMLWWGQAQTAPAAVAQKVDMTGLLERFDNLTATTQS